MTQLDTVTEQIKLERQREQDRVVSVGRANVLAEITSRQEYLEYITAKLKAVAEAKLTVWAEMGELRSNTGGACVVVAQGDRENLVGTVLATVEDGKIKRIDMRTIPPPETVNRSGDYPS